MTDEVALISGLKAGDEAAQQLFWRLFWEHTYPICVRILGKGPDSTDVTVDLLTDFMDRRVHQLANPKAIWSYVRLMAVRLSLEAKKRRAGMKTLDFDVEDFELAAPDEQAMYALLSPKLEHCLEQLSDKARQSIRLKYSGEMTHEQIGRLLGGSKQYIGRLVRKSLEALRKCLQKTAKMVGDVMPTQKSDPLTLATVEKLLCLRPKIPQVGHDDVLETLSLAASGLADEEMRRKADDHVVACAECREVLMTAGGLCEMPIAGNSSEADTTRKVSIAKAVALAAAALFLTVLGGTWFHQRNDRRADESGLVPKGDADRFTVAVGRGGSRFTLEPLDHLAPQDRIGMFYSADTSGYLAVLNLDESGTTSLLYPATGVRSAPIAAGVNVSLDDGAIVEDGEGCEWLVAVFSNTPLDLEHLRQEVASGRRTGSLCGLDVSVETARSVKILPVKR